MRLPVNNVDIDDRMKECDATHVREMKKESCERFKRSRRNEEEEGHG